MAMASGSGAFRLFNYAQCARSSLRSMCISEREGQCTIQDLWMIRWNAYSSDVKHERNTLDMNSTVNPKKKKKVFIPRVTLLSENDDMSVVTLEMAEKIANGRKLKLVKILDFDTRSERPIYKLMTSKQYIQEGLEVKKQKNVDRQMSVKGEKHLSLTTKISSHDLEIKVKSIVKFLNKKHEVRILIPCQDNLEKAEAMSNTIEQGVKDLHPTVKKTVSANKMKIHICPNLKTEILEDSNGEIKDINDKSTLDLKEST